MLLDVQMPGLTGVDVTSRLPEDGPYVIFCTAHAEHAVRAFDVGAVDYLLKPIEGERLAKALDRARARNVTRAAEGEPRALDRLPVRTRRGIVLLDPAEISHAVLEGELVTIHAAGERYLSDDSLQTLSERLPADRFERVHRRALLNLAHVIRLETNDAGGLLARTAAGDTVEVSRRSARELRRRLGLRRDPTSEG